MSLATAASPAWYVSDGDRVVGPVNTDLLLRGVAHGRVDEGYFVWQRPWPAWRRVDSLREVRAARSTPARDPSARPLRWHAELSRGIAVSRVSALLGAASDPDEVILCALGAAVEQTRAAVGLGHRPLERLGRLRTTWAHGPAAALRLGDIVEGDDPAVRASRFGPQLIPRPYGVRAGDAACRRLGEGGKLLRGVLLMPIYHRAAMVALFELGRTDHTFRTSDLGRLRLVAAIAHRELARVG